MNSFKITIKGSEWTVKFHTDATYKKKIATDSGAETWITEKTIHFNKAEINMGFIRHELLHAFVAESSVESAQLTPDQVEEVCASIIQKHWNDINLITEQILNELTN